MATATGSYAFKMKGEVFYNSVTTGKYSTENFNVVIYKLTANAAAD